MENNKKYTKEEIELIRIYYPDSGTEKLVDLLGRTRTAITKKARKLGLKYNKSKNYEKEYFTNIVKNSNNLTDICRNLNYGTTKGNRDTIKKYIKLYNIDTSHFKIVRSNPSKDYSLNEILVKDSPYSSTTNLKDKLYKNKLKSRSCELCGQGETWKGKKMSLILDHINGLNNDNRLENLRIVCPNCNATLDTHGGKNQSKYGGYIIESNIEKNKYYCDCGKEKKVKKARECSSCYRYKKMFIKTDEEYNIVKNKVKEIGYLATGRLYGVSDTAIRKRLKMYEKYKNGSIV